MPRCVNCALFLVPTLPRRQVGEATDIMNRILQSWISPATMSVEEFLCQECYKILEESSLNSSTESAVERAYGHKQVCFVCGTSILKAKYTHKVLIDSPEGEVIKSCIPIQQVHRLERVCIRCWTRARRSAKRQINDLNKQQQNLHEVVELQENMDGSTSSPSTNVSLIPKPPPQPIYKKVESPKIKSCIYKRAAATSSSCIFSECHNKDRLTVPSIIREMLLIQRKLYVPAAARICSHHLRTGPWKKLKFHLNDFTGHQMDNMMSIMKRASCSQVDFTNVRGINPHLCHYFLGMNAEQFHQLLLSIPQLEQEVPCPSVALSIVLVKLKTGDSNERLSTLFRLTRPTLERYMTKARNCLGDTFDLWSHANSRSDS